MKNFKCYQGTQFIPGNSWTGEKFVSYLGDNGVGKSAVLEAIETFFSTKNLRWFRNKESKKGPSECFVAPVFLVKESNIKKFKEKIPRISFEMDTEEVPKGYIAICVAKREDGLFTFYDGKKELSDEKNQEIAKSVYQEIIGLYQYIYIDAEVDINKEVKISSEIYEIIAGSSISSEVEKKFREQNENSKFIEELNKILEKLIDDRLAKNLKLIDGNYSYSGVGRGTTSKLTSKILARTSTEAFLSSRRLKLKNKYVFLI